MLDKILHIMGGATLSIPTENPVTTSFISGVAVELFEVATHTGRFDVWDILATVLGGVIVYWWNKCSM